MSEYERTDRILQRASRGEANAAELEECIAATRADLDRNLSAVERRLSTDELIHQAVGYLRAGPTEFLSNFGQTVKANPVPIALLSVSLGWLMLAGRGAAGNGRAAYSEGAYGRNGWAADGPYDAGAGAELGSDERYGGAASDSGMSDAVRRARESMGDQAADLSERASRLGDQATELGHRVSSKISEARSKMSDVGRHGQDVFQSARERIARARSTIGEQPRRVQDLAEHHPFVLGAVAFAVGAALAASLRRTQLEDGAMGELRDEVLDKAEDRARFGLQKGMESVQTTFTNSEDGADIEPDGERRDLTAQSTSEQKDQGSFH